MYRRLISGWLIGLVSIIVSLPQAVNADVYMKQKQHTDAVTIMGQTQPALDMVTEIWITDTKMASSNEKQTIVFDLQDKTVMFADHEQKMVSTMPMNFSTMVEEQSGDMSSGERADFEKFMGRMMNVQVSVQRTSESKKIGKWNCTKYIQSMELGMGTITSEIWATTDIDIDEDLYARFTTAVMAQMPGVSQNAASIIEETRKIKGVHVLTRQTTNMMGQSMDSTVELIEYSEAKAPDNAFAMPTGYRTQKMFE